MGASAVALLHEDPDLGDGIPAEERAAAERLIVLPAHDVGVGECDVAALHADPGLGLLVTDGIVTINVALGDRVASHLAGAGDVLSVDNGHDVLVPAVVTHFVSEPARLVALDRRFIAAVRRWPTLLLALNERLKAQERRLAVHAAIGKLRRVEDRLLALLWHLAERWGRITAEGVVVPLSLTHETLGRLAGAERPTVSLALAELARSGDVRRRGSGGFVLAERSRVVLVPEQLGRPQVRPLDVDPAALRAGMRAMRDDLSEGRHHTEELLALTAEIGRGAATQQTRLEAAPAREDDEGRSPA